VLTFLGMLNRPIRYTGMIDCCCKIYQTEGPKAFYRGMLPNFMKAVPAISISYVVYEKTRDFIVNRVDF
jgi:solute carrier family 25 phosphate transporter 23/24/25/41